VRLDLFRLPFLDRRVDDAAFEGHAEQVSGHSDSSIGSVVRLSRTFTELTEPTAVLRHRGSAFWQPPRVAALVMTKPPYE
jgi:hypothetical protein